MALDRLTEPRDSSVFPYNLKHMEETGANGPACHGYTGRMDQIGCLNLQLIGQTPAGLLDRFGIPHR